MAKDKKPTWCREVKESSSSRDRIIGQNNRGGDTFDMRTIPQQREQEHFLDIQIPVFRDEVAQAIAEALNPYNEYFRETSTKVKLANRIAESVDDMDRYNITGADRPSNMRIQIETALKNCNDLPTAEEKHKTITTIIKRAIQNMTINIIFDELE